MWLRLHPSSPRVTLWCLQRGYTVRATVRDAGDERKVKFLRDLPVAAGGSLHLFSADLEKADSFDDALSGATHVLHTAASVTLTADGQFARRLGTISIVSCCLPFVRVEYGPNTCSCAKLASADPQRQIVDVTVNGVRNVLQSCRRAAKQGTFKRFILTSSIAAVEEKTRLAEIGRRAYSSACFEKSEHASSEPDFSNLYQASRSCVHGSRRQRDRCCSDRCVLRLQERKRTVCLLSHGSLAVFSEASLTGSLVLESLFFLHRC